MLLSFFFSPKIASFKSGNNLIHYNITHLQKPTDNHLSVSVVLEPQFQIIKGADQSGRSKMRSKNYLIF